MKELTRRRELEVHPVAGEAPDGVTTRRGVQCLLNTAGSPPVGRRWTQAHHAWLVLNASEA